MRGPRLCLKVVSLAFSQCQFSSNAQGYLKRYEVRSQKNNLEGKVKLLVLLNHKLPKDSFYMTGSLKLSLHAEHFVVSIARFSPPNIFKNRVIPGV